MNRRSIVWGFAFGVLGAASLVSVERFARADGEQAAEATPPHGEWAGPHAWVGTALNSLELRADQKVAIEQLKSDLQAKAAPVRAAHAQLTEALAKTVEAGSFDHATIDPLVTAVHTAMQANHPAFEDAANRLHAILDAGQRQQLIDTLRTKAHAQFGNHQGRGADHLAKVGAELGLSDDQLATIKGKFETLTQSERAAHPHDGPGMHAHFAHMKAVADAFVSETFDAHALGVGEHASHAPPFADRHLAHVEAALSVLTPDQRTKLAQMIRSRHVDKLVGE